MTNALKEIGDWLADLVDTIREALADEAMRRVIAEDLGLPPGNEVPAADLPQDKLDNVAAYRRQANPDKEAFILLLNDVRAIYEAVRGFIAALGVSSITTQNQVLYRLFDLFALNGVRVRAPGAYFIMQLLATLVEVSAEVPGLTTDDLAEERLFKALALVEEFALSPFYYLFKVFSIKDTAGAKRASDRLFPHIAGATVYLQGRALDDSRVDYGWDGLVRPKRESPLEFIPASLTPRADELAERMLTLGFPLTQQPSDGSQARESIDFTLALVPESDGVLVDPEGPSQQRNGGLFIGVSGEGRLEIQLTDRWQFLVEASAKPAFSLFLHGGKAPNFINGHGPNDLPLNIALVSIPDETNVTYTFPHRDETHIEIGRLVCAFSFDGTSGGITARAERCALVVRSKDQDGFLAKVLPSDGLRIPFNFGLGFSTEKRFFREGGIDWPSWQQGPSTIAQPTPRSIRSQPSAHDTRPRAAARESPAARDAAPDFPNLFSADEPELGMLTTISIGKTLGPVTLKHLLLRLAPAADPSLAQAMLEISLSLAVRLGPVAATVDRLGFEMGLSFPESGGNSGFADFSMGFKTPTEIGIAVNAPTVTGGGFLSLDPKTGQYGGILELEIAETIAVKAIGLLTTRLPDGAPGFSFLILISAEGFAPIPLGLGFTLTGIGGVLGVNRTARIEALRAGLKNGTLGSLLFPRDPIRNAPQIVRDLGTLLPPHQDRFVFGPMVQLRWGTPTLLTLDLALLLELPSPQRLIVLGRLQVLLPNQAHPLIQIRMDALGVLDFSEGTVSLDATLYDSRILQFPLTGDMALQACWGREPQFVLAIGGFHPRFAAPPGLPALRRLALCLADGNTLQLRCEAYLAVTSNTVQFGARVDLHAAGGGFSFDGMLGFDAIIQLAPLAFEVEVGAALALRYHGRLLMGITFQGRLAGPTPWQVEGKAKIKFLFFSVSVSFSRTFGSKTAPPLPAAVDVVDLIVAALADRRNWSGAVPRSSASVVTLRETAPPTNGLRVHPWAELTLRERIAPLNRHITKLGTAPLVGGPTTVTVSVTDRAGAQAWRTTPVHEPFARAQFEDLREDEQLAQPAFVPLQGGLTVAADDLTVDDDAGLAAPIAYETLVLDPTRPPERPKPGYVLSAAVLARVAPFGAAGQAPARRRRRGNTVVA